MPSCEGVEPKLAGSHGRGGWRRTGLWEGDGEAWLPNPTELVSYENWVCTESSSGVVQRPRMGSQRIQRSDSWCHSSGMQGPLDILDGKMMAAGVDLNGDVLWGVSRSTEIHRRSEVPSAPTGGGPEREVLGFNWPPGRLFSPLMERSPFWGGSSCDLLVLVPQEATEDCIP